MGEHGSAGRADASRARLAAALAIKDVLGAGRALDEALLQRLTAVPDARSHGLAREIAYGCLRALSRLRALTAQLLEKPLKSRDLDVECLLLVGIYQLAFLRVPSHAAVSETVSAARALRKKPWARGFLNGVLRNFERRQEALLALPVEDDAQRLSFPPWLLTRLREAWPEDWLRVAEQSNQRPPMVLRVNAARGDPHGYAQRLLAAGMTARPLAGVPDALALDRPVDVEVLPGFGDGDVSVQDGAAQLAARLLRAEPAQQVLDACAAPGGKTAHLLELTPDLAMTAVDLSSQRLRALRENLQRLSLSARVLAADLSVPDAAWADRHYARILLDAPCSATGVIRRHPDIKWLRRPDDIPRLVQLQEKILDAVWRHLAPGGILVYVTCSLLPEENALQIQSFLQRTSDAGELPIQADWGRACRHGRQLLSGDGGMDGFYYACLTKIAAKDLS